MSVYSNTYYYPPASLCLAYSPNISSGQELDARFGRRYWWCPICSELNAIYKAQTDGKFDNAVALGVFSKLSGNYWSCQEYNGGNAYYVNSGGTGSNYKNHSYLVRAVAAF